MHTSILLQTNLSYFQNTEHNLHKGGLWPSLCRFGLTAKNAHFGLQDFASFSVNKLVHIELQLIFRTKLSVFI